MNISSSDNLIKEALSMPENERARIAEKLIVSLHDQPSHKTDEAWHIEIERRVKEINSDEVQCIPWEDIRDRLSEVCMMPPSQKRPFQNGTLLPNI
ncbi:MAG: addiction module protein [Desulfobacteraceae bacterium]|nr:addiction module protein [Desulfobacteraceae bacterium]